MQINQNISALFAYRSLTNNQNGVSTSMERLSSGLRINRAADDAAGLAISENMRTQVNGLNQGARNAGDGISLLRTAEGALNETHAILQRMRTLAVQAANVGVMTSENLQMVQVEMGQLIAEIDRIAYETEFNGTSLLDGTFREKSCRWGPMPATPNQ
ncbi:flagellin [Kineosphaera limosa]|uniref:Flagellin n=1 Tax=Kineosphaera limosa NBRC 100340 TaxID=1184609 RepID=K6VMM7_9MICO|nr:putative flagellin [Kineosphaera limosa]NYD99852.1 flagellin [Kineosphaera limosa]GAB97473.1 putative flagellin [Kineosphaera limosa NBRC 100340]